ncbi:hypothetical protein [Halobacteriovorax sp. HLS]|uniref:hypothetical protein n=1 Tax=Halobacteriovorax sp. HLS TaxID=2234000 RepID=UPI000FD7F027|nr:hypothetical protein [Halobacteriovorax sp. HLS]
MKTLITLSLLSLSTLSFAGSVGESSTDCLKNQSTQSRGSKQIINTDTSASVETSSKKQKEQ